ncbi:BnaC05g21880D [Brassica napus]|uniref:BnaC05g21880D protein n=1 Tax=Brassica napus TaxID=3708 RepID=A0A078GZZ5_BRANA|nr:BnaC05g21880D [Brassica napus]
MSSIFLVSAITITANRLLETLQFKSPIWLCPSSKIWKVDTSSSSDKNYVTTGGSSSTRESFFRIQKYGNDESTYKLLVRPPGFSNLYNYESDSVIKGIGATTGFFGAPILVLEGDNDDNNVFPVKFREVDTSTENVFAKGLRMFPTF